MENQKTPTVFVSYSWTSPSHENWVTSLAERLMSDGIEVKFDKWDLKEGQDKYSFMESMAKSNNIDKVLMILDKAYAEKANDRKGGVGTETQIISPQVYENISQEKFIPIVRERDENGKEYIPNYLASRIYIDLSFDEHFEDNYEKLIRNIFARPANVKPSLGKAPSYIFEANKVSFKTTSTLKSFESNIDKHPKRVNSYIQDFLNNYFDNLKEFAVTVSGSDYVSLGKATIESINSYTPLRNELISFFSILLKSHITYDYDLIQKFLERLFTLTYPNEHRGSWYDNEFDIYRFIIHETFIYLAAISLKTESYDFLADLFYSSYFINDSRGATPTASKADTFYKYIHSIDAYYKQTYSKNLVSCMADIIINRIPDTMTKDDIIDADLICHHILQLNNMKWFPITYIYKDRPKPLVFIRLESKRHFEKTKAIFNVNTIQELKDLITYNKSKGISPVRYHNAFDEVIPIHKLIDVELIGTSR